MSASADASSRELVFTRTFAAPRDLVWAAWTDPAHLARWWGPMAFTVTTESAAVEAGGEWRFVMHGPDGTDYRNHIVYDEVVEPERLVYRHVPEPGDEPVSFETTITLTELEGATLLTMRMRFPTAEMLKHVVETYGAVEGAHQTLGRLERHLAGTDAEEQFVVTRTFDAPRDLVYRAFTEAGHLAHWWGPASGGHPSGSPAFVMTRGTFVHHEAVAPERAVFTLSFPSAFSGWPREVLTTVTFEDDAGRTVLTLYASPVGATQLERRAFRDAFRPLQQGFGDAFAQLAEYLSVLAGRGSV